MPEEDKAQELLETILKAIVYKPEEVKVKKTMDEMGVMLLVSLGDGDAGPAIGKEGRTIQAIRTVMSVVGAKDHARISVKLDVPEKRPTFTAPLTGPPAGQKKEKGDLEDLKL